MYRIVAEDHNPVTNQDLSVKAEQLMIQLSVTQCWGNEFLWGKPYSLILPYVWHNSSLQSVLPVLANKRNFSHLR